MRRVALITGLGLLVAGAIVWVVPYLTDDRDYFATTPQPDPLVALSTVAVSPREQACMDRAVVDTHSEQARFRVGTVGRTGEPLALSLRGFGYHAAARVPGGYKDSQVLKIPVAPPRRAVEVAICIRNLGSRRVLLIGADDRTHSRSRTWVDGQRVAPNFSIVFFERRPTSIVSGLNATFGRIGAFRPAGVSPVTLWPLMLLFVIGVPLATLLALADAVPHGRRRADLANSATSQRTERR